MQMSASNYQTSEPVVQDYEGTVNPGTLASSPSPSTTAAAASTLPGSKITSDLPVFDCRTFNSDINSGNINVQEVVVLDKATYFPMILLVDSAADLHSRNPDDLRGKKAIFMNYKDLPQGTLPSGESFFFLPRKEFSKLGIGSEPNGRAYFPMNKANMIPAFSYHNEMKERMTGGVEYANGSTDDEPFTVIFIVLLVSLILMSGAAVMQYKGSK